MLCVCAGGLACQSANGKNQLDMSVSQRCQVSASPQVGVLQGAAFVCGSDELFEGHLLTQCAVVLALRFIRSLSVRRF